MAIQKLRSRRKSKTVRRANLNRANALPAIDRANESGHQDRVPKELADMSHAERMAAIMRDLNSSSCLGRADEVIALIKKELEEAHGVREMVAKRYNVPPSAVVRVDQDKSPPKEKSENNLAGTVGGLVDQYRSHKDSRYQVVRFHTRRYYNVLCDRIKADHGSDKLSEIKLKDLENWYAAWRANGKESFARSLIGMARMLFTFGTKNLEDYECERLAVVISKLRTRMPKERTETLTPDYVKAIRAMAHKENRHSIALAQAFQFELPLSQKDVIGEWVPLDEPGLSDVHYGNEKWLRGLRWEEIDENFILRHTRSVDQKAVEIDLKKNAPMVMEEIAWLGTNRPSSGPIVVSDYTKLPWSPNEFRRFWRIIATAAGVPKNLRNTDTPVKDESRRSRKRSSLGGDR